MQIIRDSYACFEKVAEAKQPDHWSLTQWEHFLLDNRLAMNQLADVGFLTTENVAQNLQRLKELVPKTLKGRGGKLVAMELPPWADPCDEPPPPVKDPKGSKGGKGGGAPEEEVRATLSCDWRLQRALPEVTQQLPGAALPLSMAKLRIERAASAGERYRTRPLAMRYTSAKDLVQFEARLNAWRGELSDNHKIEPDAWPPYAAAAAVEINEIPSAAPRSAVRGGIATWPPREWGDKWRAPYVPHHMALGDPLARKSKVDYIGAHAVLRTRRSPAAGATLVPIQLSTRLLALCVAHRPAPTSASHA